MRVLCSTESLVDYLCLCVEVDSKYCVIPYHSAGAQLSVKDLAAQTSVGVHISMFVNQIESYSAIDSPFQTFAVGLLVALID